VTTKRTPQRRPRRRRTTPAKREAVEARPLIDRILDTPNLARIVPQLRPEVLHRVIESCGLEDCGELLSLVTPGQLAGVFDLDLWRADASGLDEQFDADSFGIWLETLVASGADHAAATLAAIDIDLMIAGFAQHVLVNDAAAGALSHDGISCEIGGCRIIAKRTDAWDAVVAVLRALDGDHPVFFRRLMGGCRTLSNAGFELDGLDDLLPAGEQVMFDIAFDRERRREQQGYTTPAQARAFLRASRTFRAGNGAAAAVDPVARAYFRAIEPVNGDEPPSSAAADVAPVVDLLLDAGILPQPPRALLAGAAGDTPRLSRIQAQMQFLHEHDVAAYSSRSQELAYLANALATGCSRQGRPFSPEQASEAAVAACNLGLENWSGESLLPEGFLVDHDLICVFQTGWTVLHEQVCMATARRLIRTLERVRCEDPEVQSGLDELQIEMSKAWQAGTPWRARESLDVIMLLDQHAWATLVALIDECPVIHSAIAISQGARTRAIKADAFELISENSQIASVDAFMRTLHRTLSAR